MDANQVFSIERPHANLLTLYIFRSVLSGPFFIFVLPFLYFRYSTMRYRFDDEGVSMRWGLLFRREVNLTYARIQDIHLKSGIIQRWLKLADLQIQTASGSAAAEMTIEGLLEYASVRDFLYNRMRGTDESEAVGDTDVPGDADTVESLLESIVDELRASRCALERLADGSKKLPSANGGDHV